LIQPERKGQVISYGVIGKFELGVEKVFQARPSEGLFLASQREFAEGESLDLAVRKILKMPGKRILDPVAGKRERSFQ
jgi:hypothetical protein